MSAIILRDEIIHYEVLGRGRPIVFLHDWIGSWRYWIPAMQAVSLSYRTYALDLWGFGDSAKKVNYYSIRQQVALLEEFLAEMGIGKVALIGHGLGAIVALLYSSRTTGQVDRMMAIGLPMDEDAINVRLHSEPPGQLAEWLIEHNSVSAAVRLEALKADQKAILLSFTTLQNIDLRTQLLGIYIPCLLVHGQNDPAIQIPQPHHLHSLPDLVHHIILDQSGHYPMLDEPSKFNRLLVDFLNLDSGERPSKIRLKDEWKRRVR